MTTFYTILGAPPGTAPANADTGLTALAATLTTDLAGPLAMMDWAEDEIDRAVRRYPSHADVLYHAFTLLRPRDLGPGMANELVYRCHAAELLQPSPPTATPGRRPRRNCA